MNKVMKSWGDWQFAFINKSVFKKPDLLVYWSKTYGDNTPESIPVNPKLN